MTVIKNLKNEQIEYCWFNKDDKERRSIYPQTALMSEKLDDLSDEELKRRPKQARV